ncbi:MAG: glutamate racemase [Steroidobacteraceae bacterium]
MNAQSMAVVTAARDLPIGVFDSGVGGLTVLRALQSSLPQERFIYLGDTARLPYGTKSAETIIRYSLQAAAYLVGQGIKCLVVACNTASSAALEVLRAHHPDLPIVGVVEPGAAAGCRASSNGRIAVIATEGTVRGGAYQRAITRIRADATVIARACPLFVPLAEEGWVNGPIVEAIARSYLDELFTDSHAPDTLVLGCTHFPVLRPALASVVGQGVTIVDSADTTAEAVVELLREHDLFSAAAGSAPLRPRVRFLATDGRERFARVAAYFLERPISPESVELIDPGFAVGGVGM